MIKKLFIFVILVSGLISCKEVQPDTTIPAWLQEKIDTYSENCIYYGSKATRYRYDSIYIYELRIPIYSCSMCDIYYANGDSVKWSDSTIMYSDYKKYRTKPKVLWEFTDDKCLKY